MGNSNFDNAKLYTSDVNRTSGIIGETPWGKFIDKTSANPDFLVIEGKFKVFLQAQGVRPFGGNYQGALQDIMWNAGSPEFMENAIATRRPIVAFVENAPANRGFSNFELTTALKYPNAVINGYPVSAFGSDPLGFVSKSAAEFQQLERAIAQAATANSGQPVTVAQIRANVNLIDGYDAVGKTLFSQPIDVFKSLSLDEMSAARTAWIARGEVLPSLRSGPIPDAPERLPRTAAEPGAPRGPPPVAEPPHTSAKAAAEAMPEALMPKGLSPSGKLMLKGAGAAGVALMAYDFASTGHKVVELRSQGNATGANSAMTHFAGRSVGGIAGGFLFGAGYGALAGVETGPGMLVTGLVGGVIGAYAGEKWAEQRDNDAIYKQIDSNGNEWRRDPNHPQGPWTRVADTQQLKAAPGAPAAPPGQDVTVAPKTDSDGDAVYRTERYVAAGNLARQLNYQSANASYELGLANPPTPRNPYSIPGEAADKPGWHAGNWTRDAQGEWSRVLVGPMPRSEFQAPEMQTQPATPQQKAELDGQSQLLIAQNAANTPAAVAARYQIAYNQFGWEREGAVPAAIRNAAASVGTLQASNGNTYQRGADGEWTHDGWIRDTKAEGNIRNELNAVYQSQQAGLADMAAIAQHAKAHPQPQLDPLRELVEGVYKAAGVTRTDAELEAATAAVRRDHQRDGLGNRSYTLQLLPDPITKAHGANSPIATLAADDDGNMVMRSVTTPQEMQQTQGAPAPAPSAPTGSHSFVPDAPTGEPERTAGVNAPNPFEQSKIGQLLDRFFDASAKDDHAALAQVARDYEKTDEYQQWEQWGRNAHQRMQAEQLAQAEQSAAPQRQSSQGHTI